MENDHEKTIRNAAIALAAENGLSYASMDEHSQGFWRLKAMETFDELISLTR